MTGRSHATRDRMIGAAFGILRANGYGGASARAIAAAGAFNQALIFYHFGTVDDLLLAALDRSSEMRLARYREAFASVTTLPQLAASASALFREDAESGHVKVLAEMVAAGSSKDSLGRQVAARVEPWTAFTRETFARLTAGTPFAALINPDDAAYALTSLYLGMELLSGLEGADERSVALFAAASRMASLFGALLPTNGGT